MANIERLEQLRRVVLAAPDNELFDMKHITKLKNCGTAHCAFGWALVDTWFQKNTNITISDFNDSPRIFDLFWRDVNSLFLPYMAPWEGSIAKALVIANIDRLIRGEPAIPYGKETD